MKLARLFGLDVSVQPSAGLTYGVLGIGLLVYAAVRLRLRPPAALSFAGGVLVLHILFVMVHHLGHAAAAWSVGYPMIGVRLYGPLASSVYPEGEPPLLARLHLRRAMGGPVASVLLALLIALLGPIYSRHRVGRVIWRILLLDNLVDLGLGSLLPLDFADGGTIRRYWPERRRSVPVLE
jgi:hypothetical protein